MCVIFPVSFLTLLDTRESRFCNEIWPTLCLPSAMFRSVTLCFLSLTGWPIDSRSRSHIGLVGTSTWETQKWRQCADHYSWAAHGSECPCCQNKGLQERRRKQGAWGDYYWLQYSRGTFLRVPSFQPLKLPSQKHFALVAQGDLAQVGIFHFFVFIFYFSQSNSLFNFEKYIAHAQPANLRVNPLTPMGGQDRISPYNINTMSSRQVMRIQRI